MKIRKKLVLILIFFGFILILSGSYALFSYSRTGNLMILRGDKIELTYTNSNGFLLSNTFPMSAEEARSRSDNLFEFTVTGTNHSKKGLYYDINLVHGTETTTSKFWDYDISFDLGYYNNSEMVYLLENYSVDKINHTTIYSEVIPEDMIGNSSSFTRNYFLRIWLSDKAIISDSEGVGAHYRSTSNGTTNLPIFKDCSSIINVEVSGDLVKRDNTYSITDMYDYMSDGAVVDQFGDTYYSNGDRNGKYLYYPTQNNEYPIYYLRDRNNGYVTIGDTCWKTIRTTEHGGTKLLYYGKTVPAYEKKYVDTSFVVSNYADYSFSDNKFYKTFTSSGSNQDLTFNLDLIGDYIIEARVVTHSNSNGSSSFSMTFDKNGVVFNGWGNGGESDRTNYVYFTCDNLSDQYTIHFNPTCGGTSEIYVEICIYTFTDKVQTEKSCDLENHAIEINGENKFTNSGANGDDIIHSFAGISYMYGDKDEVLISYPLKTKNIYLGTGFSYDRANNKYSLKNGKNFVEKPDFSYRYTFLEESDIHSESFYSYIGYMFSFSPAYNTYKTFFVARLKNGESFDEHMNRMFEPIHDSNYKYAIDKFYEEKLYKYGNLFEDEVYCNSKSYSFDISNSNSLDLQFNDRNYSMVNLACPNDRDKYTVSKERGNGALKYPIALPTKSETNMAQIAMLYANNTPLTMTPNRVDFYASWHLASGTSNSFSTESLYPAVTLKHGVKAIRGTGTLTDPFVIAE